METGPRFKVSSEGLEERVIEPAIHGLQDKHANHCATPAPVIRVGMETLTQELQN